MHLTKAETWKLAADLGTVGGVDVLETVREMSHTDYNGDRSERHAWGYGRLDNPASVLRAKGYEEAQRRGGYEWTRCTNGLALRRGDSLGYADVRDERYAVKAVWRTLQGEGAWAGRPAVFVRFAGCNMWTGEEAIATGTPPATGPPARSGATRTFGRLAAEAVAPTTSSRQIRRGRANRRPVHFVVLTGGAAPPGRRRTRPRAACRGFEVPPRPTGPSRSPMRSPTQTGMLVPRDWVCAAPSSPKTGWSWSAFDEFKLVVPDYPPDGYARFAERLRPPARQPCPPLPLASAGDGPRQKPPPASPWSLALAPPAWRVSVQTHKILDVD